MFATSLAAVWPLVLHPNWIPMPYVDQVTDYTLTHLQIFRYFHTSLVDYGQFPLWNSWQFSGQPLIGYWYPPSWFAILVPQPWMLNMLGWLHIFWGGIGVYLFLKNGTAGRQAAVFGAAAWMMTPRMAATFASGQISFIFALNWLPWLALLARRAAQIHQFRDFILISVILSMTVYAEMQSAYIVVCFLAAYLVYLFITYKTPWRVILKYGVISFILFCALVAIEMLPLMEFLNHSRRVALSMEIGSLYDLSWISFIGMLIPIPGQIFEVVTYLGIGVLLLAVAGASRKCIFWIGLAALCMLIGLGDKTPVYPLLHQWLPGFSVLRVPSRLWYIVIFSAVVLATKGFKIMRECGQNLDERPRLVRITVALSALTTSLGLVVWFMTGSFNIGLVNPLVIAAFFSGVTLFYFYHLISERIWVFSTLALLFVDLLIANATLLLSTPLPEPGGAIRWIASQPGIFRVYSPTGSLRPVNHLQQAVGVYPVHLDYYARFLGRASGYASGDYSVSVPDIYIDGWTPGFIIERMSRPDVTTLGLLNVRYLLSSIPLHSPDLKLLSIIDGERIYENMAVQPRVWRTSGTIQSVEWSPLCITVKTGGEAGRLIFSEVIYPGWLVTVDGFSAQIEPYQEILRSVNLPPGVHTVVMKYRPVTVTLGALISSAGWGAIILLAWGDRRRFFRVENQPSKIKQNGKRCKPITQDQDIGL